MRRPQGRPAGKGTKTTQPTLTPSAFAQKWRGITTTENAAYVQLLGYKDDLGNPPLLIVSHLERIEIHTEGQ